MPLPDPHAPSRRQFLACTAAAGVGAFNALARADAPKADPNYYAGFRLGVQTFTYRDFSLERALKEIQSLGLKYVEFSNSHLPRDNDPEKLKGVPQLCAEYGLTPLSFGVKRFSKNHDDNKKVFDAARLLGLRFIAADPDPDSFDSLDNLCEAAKIAIAIHPHGPSKEKAVLHRWYSAEVIMAAVKDHHPLVGSCLDTGHLIRSAQLGKQLDPAQQIRIMGPRNFGIHLKDHDNKRKTDVVFGSPDGALDVVGVMKALRDVKFDGYMSIEYEANKENPFADMQKCVAYLKQAAQKLG